MSSFSLSEIEIELLERGLNFTPTPKVQKTELDNDKCRFTRKLRLEEFFLDNDNADDSIVRNPSTFTPERDRDKHLETYIEYLNHCPSKTTDKNNLRSNINRKEREAIQKLQARNEIVIKEADKGSAVVIMNKSYYKDKILELLNDPETYSEIPNNMDKKTMSKINSLVTTNKSNLTKKEIDYLTNFEYKTSQFYGLPKIHKSKLIQKAIEEQNSSCVNIQDPEDLKFRPIVAGPICPTSRLSNLLDILLRPFIKYVKSYVRDDLDFLNHLPENIGDEMCLITMDITSLYSNIHHDLGFEAIGFWLDKYAEDIHPRIEKQFILSAMKTVLENNNFVFNEKNYLQISGTAMGTKFAPTYATLVLGYLEIILYKNIEDKHGLNTRNIFENSLKRFLDDVFLIWNKSLISTEEIVDFMNALHSKLKFTHETSDTSLPFLDVLIIIENGRIITDIYHKPTDTKQYLDYKSCHPRSTKNNVPYCLARRICTIVTDGNLRKKRLQELKVALKNRNYPTGVIEKGISMASQLDIKTLRTPKTQNNDQNIIPYVSTYSPNAPHMYSHIMGGIHILRGSNRMQEVLNSSSFIKSNRQGPNLKKLLTRARFTEDEKHNHIGSRKCGDKRCKCCINILETTSFTFHKTNQIFDIKSSLTCTSKNLIYVIICNGCSEYYIGETGDYLRNRCTVHRQGIRHCTSISVDRHIHHCAKQSSPMFNILPFYKMRQNCLREERLKMENKFIETLKPSLNRIK